MSTNEIPFHGGVRTAVWFVVVFPLLIVAIGVPIRLSEFVATLPPWATVVLEDLHFVFLLLFTWIVLRWDGVPVADLGLSAAHFRLAVLAFGAIWIALNFLGVGVAAATGNDWGYRLLWETQPRPVVLVPLLLLFTGTVEEFTIRGYFQTKLIALRGGQSHLDVAVGILGASVFFGLAHVPALLLDGASLGQVGFGVAYLSVSGMVFGVFYELTHNVYFVGLLHGFGNMWVLVVDWWSWAGVAFVAFLVGQLTIYAAVAYLYRSRLLGTTVTPAVRRREVTRASN